MTVAACLLVVGCGSDEGSAGAAIAEAQQAMTAEMIDPASAIFSEVSASDGGTAVCGYVNGKNRFGGYTGKKRFVWVRGGAAQVEPEASRSTLVSADAAGAPRCIFDLTYRDCKGETGLPSISTCTDVLVGNVAR